MVEQLLALLTALLKPDADPRLHFQAVPSAPLEEFAELAFQAAFWSSYERNKRGESTEIVGLIDKESLWHAATGLPMPREADRSEEDLGWLLEPAQELLVNLRDGGPLAARIDSVSLQTLQERLSESLLILRREMRQRGLAQPVAKLVAIPSD